MTLTAKTYNTLNNKKLSNALLHKCVNPFVHLLLDKQLISCNILIYNMVYLRNFAKGTNWEQKFQKPQNGNTCLTNLNVENKGNFPILAFDY